MTTRLLCVALEGAPTVAMAMAMAMYVLTHVPLMIPSKQLLNFHLQSWQCGQAAFCMESILGAGVLNLDLELGCFWIDIVCL